MPLSPAVAQYDAILLDLDGCLWIGDEPIEGSVAAVAALREAGKAIAFLTNETRYSPEELVRKLWRLGFQAGVHEVVTVGAAVQFRLAERDGGSAFVVGWQAIVDHVADAGLRIVNGTTFASRADVVVVSGHEGFDYAELRTAAQAVIRGAELVGATRDATFPKPDGPWPGSGAVLAAVEYAAGRQADLVIGKPEPPMYEAVLDRLGRPDRVLAVGDRPEIDVAGARRAGIDAALVLTGGASPDGVDAKVADSLAALVLS
jgi:HAD superfamily hydrolase (TIGR01450 family)